MGFLKMPNDITVNLVLKIHFPLSSYKSHTKLPAKKEWILNNLEANALNRKHNRIPGLPFVYIGGVPKLLS